MIPELTLAQVESVESIFSSLSLEEKIGHLIMPEDRKYSPEVWAELVKEIPIGAAYLFATGRLDCSVDEIRRKVEAVQEVSRVPVIIAAGMEHGFEGGTIFPRAAVKAWFGEIPADSPCPVKMPYGSPRTLR